MVLVGLALDTDGDGLGDSLETVLGTNPLDADSDDDGLTDGAEDANHNGALDSGETNASHSDSDGDGIQDGTEAGVTIGIVDPDGGGPLLGTGAGFVADVNPRSTATPTTTASATAKKTRITTAPSTALNQIQITLLPRRRQFRKCRLFRVWHWFCSRAC